MWERKIRLQSTTSDGAAAAEEVLQVAAEDSSGRTRLTEEFRTSVTQRQQENTVLPNFKL